MQQHNASEKNAPIRRRMPNGQKGRRLRGPLPPALLERLDAEAERQMRSRAAMVAVIISDYFAAQDAAHPAPGGAQVHADSFVPVCAPPTEEAA